MKRFQRHADCFTLLLILLSHRNVRGFTSTSSIGQSRSFPSRASVPSSSSLKSLFGNAAIPRSNSRQTVSKTKLEAVAVPSSWSDRWQRIVSKPKQERPAWARDWMPTWLLNLRPSIQLAAVLLLYVFHLTVLTQRSISFPFQLIPNERGHFQSIGLDS